MKLIKHCKKYGIMFGQHEHVIVAKISVVEGIKCHNIMDTNLAETARI